MKRSIVFGLILWALSPAFAFEYNGLEYTVLSQSGSTANVSVQQGSTTPKGASCFYNNSRLGNNVK